MKLCQSDHFATIKPTPMDQTYILYVDDEPDILRIMTTILKSSGFQPLTAESCAEAMAHLAHYQEQILLVVSDFQMPHEDGLALRRKMLEKWADIPFVLITGYGSMEMAIDAIPLKINQLVEKPLDQDTLLPLITKFANERKEQLEERRQLLEILMEETQGQLEEIEEQILTLEQNPEAIEAINVIFRLVHTIKGNSSFLDLSVLEKYAHGYEDLLTLLKNQVIPVSKSIIEILLEGFDTISAIAREIKKPTNRQFDVPELVKIFAVDCDFIRGEYTESKPEQTSSITQPNEEVKGNKEERHIVSTKLLDEFLELSSELTVIRNSMHNIIQAFAISASDNEYVERLKEAFDGMQKISGLIQSKIIELRKVPMETVYKGLPRVVRDLATSSDKQVRLVLVGEDIKIDKSIGSVLGKILIHMVRNSVDHAIESVNVRMAAGKPKEGLIELHTIANADEVILKITDDGKGLDRQLITEKAITNALFSPEELEVMSDDQVFQLIFESGFSTAQKVSNVSGRGVGMDMVKSSIDAAKGRIEIESQKGKGSCFSLHLPVPKYVLIIDSLLFRTGKYQFAIPIEAVTSLGTRIVTTAGQKPMIRHNDLVVFVWDIPCLIENRPNQIKIKEENLVLIIQDQGRIAGIVIDECLGQFEIVIRPFDRFLSSFEYCKGTALLDNSKMCLVIDPEKIIDMVIAKQTS